jgi:hypothetical protein
MVVGRREVSDVLIEADPQSGGKAKNFHRKDCKERKKNIG